jgi:hypothetical protein
MLQVFQRHVVSVCSKCFICFSDLCLQAFLIWLLHMFHTYCKSMSQWFQLCQSYVAVTVFMLQVASVLSGCCVCFTHMVKCICFKWYAFRRILHSSVSYFRCVFRESWGTESYRRGRARPHPVSQVPPARREGSGVAGKETWAQRQGRVRVRSVARWTRRVTWASQHACPYRRPGARAAKKK